MEELPRVSLPDVYRPPVSSNAPGVRGEGQPFYVVSQKKFLVLYVATLGMYQLFWFYMNWSRYKQYTEIPARPFWRAIFAIIFTHRLFQAIARTAVPEAGLSQWRSAPIATIFVVLSLVSHVLRQIAGHSEDYATLDLVALGLELAAGWPLLVAQRVANVACGDPAGETNQEFTPANYIVLFLGVGLGTISILGLIVPELVLID